MCSGEEEDHSDPAKTPRTPRPPGLPLPLRATLRTERRCQVRDGQFERLNQNFIAQSVQVRNSIAQAFSHRSLPHLAPRPLVRSVPASALILPSIASNRQGGVLHRNPEQHQLPPTNMLGRSGALGQLRTRHWVRQAMPQLE